MDACPTAAVHDLTGALVLNLTPAAGYFWIGRTGIGGRTYRRNETDSPYSEGAAEITPAVAAAARRSERIRVGGDEPLTGTAYWQSLDDRVDALDQAVSTPFLWAVSGGGHLYTYRTVGPADIEVGELEKMDFAAGRRFVLLSFTVQPNPTKATL